MDLQCRHLKKNIKIDHEEEDSRHNISAPTSTLPKFLSSFVKPMTSVSSDTAELTKKRSRIRKCRSFNASRNYSTPACCFICSKQLKILLQSHSPDVQKKRKKTKKISSPTAESDQIVSLLHFLLVDCLGMTMTLRQMKVDLEEASSFDINTFLCKQHMEIVEKGFKLDTLIREMQNELDSVKHVVKKAVQQRFPCNFEEIIECKLETEIGLYKTEFVDGDDREDANSENDIILELENVDDIDFDFCEIDPSPEPDSISFCDANPTEDEWRSNLVTPKNEKTEDAVLLRKGTRSSRRVRAPLQNPRESTPNSPNVQEDMTEFVCFEIKEENQNDNLQHLDSPSPSPASHSDSSYKNDSESDEKCDSDWEAGVANLKRQRHTIKSKTKSVPKKCRETVAKSGRSSTKIRKRKATKDTIDKIKKFKCYICYKRFETIEERKSHRLSEHGDGPFLQCDHCPNKYKKKKRLQDHIIRVHGSGERTFLCDECPKTYFVSEDLAQHKRQFHTASVKKIMTCPYCTSGKRYKGSVNLAAHIRVKHKIGDAIPRKKLVCEFCGKVYSDPQEFKKHKDKIHLNTYEPSFCDICGKKLSDWKSVQKHKLSQHSKAFQYRCELCGSGSLFKSHLIAHYKHGHASLSPEEMDNLIQNCKKVLDNTNPIYRQEELA